MFHAFRRRLQRRALADPAYGFLFDTPPNDEFVSLDCETTGLNPKKDEVISVGAVRIKGRRIETSDAFHIRVKPTVAMARESIKIHQIRKTDLVGEGSMPDALPELLRFIGSRPLVGYWIGFDVRMLNTPVSALLGIKLPHQQIDVCDLYYDRKYGNAPPGTHVDLRFAAIIEDLHLPVLQLHDALNDAVLAAEMFLILRDLKARGVHLRRDRNTALPGLPVG